MDGLVDRTLGERDARAQCPQRRALRPHMTQYMTRRAKDWAARGFKETLVDFPTLNARSKFWRDDQRAAFRNWEEIDDIRNPLGERQGVHERVVLRELLRRGGKEGRD